MLLMAMSGVFGSIRYFPATVTAVEPVLRSDQDRLVTVEIGTYLHEVRTRDRLVTAEVGRPVCVKETTVIAGKFVTRALALPVFCRRAMAQE